MSKLPTKNEILDWISAHPTQGAKRDIAKAFGIKGAARIDLKRMLKELESEGHLQRRKRSYREPDKLPPVSVLQVQAPGRAGRSVRPPAGMAGRRAGAARAGHAARIRPCTGRGRPHPGTADRGQGRRPCLRGTADPQDRLQPPQDAGHLPPSQRRRSRAAHRQGIRQGVARRRGRHPRRAGR